MSEIKIGLVVRKDYGGLAFQTHAIHKMLKPHKTLVIDSTVFNQSKQHKGWYPDAEYTSSGYIDDEMLRDFLTGLDAVLSCEVPYSDNFYSIARSMKVKTILQPNAELNPHFRQRFLDKPDAFILPSRWYEEETRHLGVRTYYCPPPIDIEPMFIERSKEKGQLKILHMKGKKAAYDRNGSDIVSALKIEGVDIHIHDQLENPIEDQSDIYKQGYDIVLMPRRYGGLCLPVYESLGFGLPVVMPYISPNYFILPKEWLVSATQRRIVRTKRSVWAYATNHRKLSDKLIEFRDMDNDQFQKEKQKARNIYDKYIEDQSEWFDIIEHIVRIK